MYFPSRVAVTLAFFNQHIDTIYNSCESAVSVKGTAKIFFFFFFFFFVL